MPSVQNNPYANGVYFWVLYSGLRQYHCLYTKSYNLDCVSKICGKLCIYLGYIFFWVIFTICRRQNLVTLIYFLYMEKLICWSWWWCFPYWVANDTFHWMNQGDLELYWSNERNIQSPNFVLSWYWLKWWPRANQRLRIFVTHRTETMLLE